MSTENKVTPPKTVVSKLVVTPDQMPTALAPREPVGADDRLVDFRQYINSKLCYHPAALADASVVGQTKKEAYQVDIYTLIDERSIEWKEKPYTNESYPAETVQIFDERFDIPETIIKSKKKFEADISRSQNKVQCPACEGSGHKKCSICFGRGTDLINSGRLCRSCDGSGRQGCTRCNVCGSILTWARISVAFYTVHSTSYHKNTFLPDSCIRKADLKQTFFNKDEEWAVERKLDQFASNLNLCQTIKNSSAVEYWLAVEQQYMNKHVSKVKANMKIRRMQIVIDKVNIIETDYSLGAYVNKRNPTKGDKVFTFLQYGPDKTGLPQIYENDYPLAMCGCISAGCACQSFACTII